MRAGRERERGSALVLVVVGLLAMIGMAGLALDTAHVLLNKSRLQSALDAAALSAAKVLDQSGSTGQATTAAGAVFTLNVNQFPELQKAVGQGLTLNTQFSSTLNPFNPGTLPAAYVRTAIANFPTTMSLSSVMGIATINVAGSAVAGPSAALVTACNVVPIFMCNNPAGAPPFYGYALNQVVALNGAAAGAIGPGNYGLLALGGNGAANVRSNLAGDYGACATVGNTAATEPGVANGPVSQGLNTRFNQYQGPVNAQNYPPDVINTAAHQTNLTQAGNGNILQNGAVVTTAAQLNFNYADYTALAQANTFDTQPLPNGTAAFERRVVAVPMGDCTGAVNGKGTVTINGFACAFLLQALPNGGGKNPIFAQIIQGCNANGTTGVGAGNTGPHKIVLYKSAGSADS